jgi:hypothetical protein
MLVQPLVGYLKNATRSPQTLNQTILIGRGPAPAYYIFFYCQFSGNFLDLFHFQIVLGFTLRQSLRKRTRTAHARRILLDHEPSSQFNLMQLLGLDLHFLDIPHSKAHFTSTIHQTTQILIQFKQ